MSRTLLLIGTRKGAFFLESNDRKTWELQGPFCEGWPVYHMIGRPKKRCRLRRGRERLAWSGDLSKRRSR